MWVGLESHTVPRLKVLTFSLTPVATYIRAIRKCSLGSRMTMEENCRLGVVEEMLCSLVCVF